MFSFFVFNNENTSRVSVDISNSKSGVQGKLILILHLYHMYTTPVLNNMYIITILLPHNTCTIDSTSLQPTLRLMKKTDDCGYGGVTFLFLGYILVRMYSQLTVF